MDRTLVGLVTVCLVVLMIGPGCGRPAAPDSPPPAATRPADAGDDEPLVSLLRRTDDVFASHPRGVFRASLGERRWHRLPTPPQVPLGGTFATAPPGERRVFYTGPLTNVLKPNGLYRSDDDGRTWVTVSNDRALRYVFVHPSGELFALTYVPSAADDGRPTTSERMIASRDGGGTWRDITNGRWGELGGFFADPDHPGQVCAIEYGNRVFFLQADDQRYRWRRNRAVGWWRGRETDEQFFGRDYGAGTTHYMHRATLANALEHDFGSDVRMPAFDVVPARPRYTFAREGPKRVEVTLAFLPERPAGEEVWLTDEPDGQSQWAVRVIDPGGRRLGLWTAAGRAATRATSRPNDVPRTGRRFERVVVARDRPYRRTIDLAAYDTFDEPGEYRVQLRYHTDHEARLALGGWAGSFAGTPFTVVIE